MTAIERRKLSEQQSQVKLLANKAEKADIDDHNDKMDKILKDA